LTLYKDHGLITIPVDRNKKAIVTFKDIISQNDPRCAISPQQNVAALTGYRSRLILLDIDRPHEGEYDGREYMKDIFPDLKTASVKSPKGYHMWFTITDDRIYQIPNSTRVFHYNNRPVSIDIRNNGGYALLPPSVTSDGQYTWERPLSEAIPMPESMIELLLNGSEKKKHVVFRQESPLPQEEDISEIIECFEKAADHVKVSRASSYSDWVTFMFSLATYMNSDVSDNDFYRLEQCAHRFSRRSARYDSNETATKLQSIIDGESRTTVATPLYWLKKDNPDKFTELYAPRREKWLQKTLLKEVENAQELVKCIEDFVHLASRPGGHLQEFYARTIPLVVARIGDPRTYIIIKRNGSRPSFNGRAFREHSYGGDTFRVIMGGGESKEMSLYDLANRYAKKYESTTFSVDNTHDPRDYNLYPGLRVSYISEGKRDQKAVDFYNNHMKQILCSGDEFIYRYLTKWLFEAFRGRGRAIPAIVFKGVQGCGKSIFWIDFVMTRIFGECGAPIRTVKDLTKDFNGIISQKTLLVADETGTGKNKCDRNVMKTALTAVRGIIERKGLEATVEDLYFAAVFLTNDKNSVPIEENDRRFMCIDITAAVNEKAYFAQFLLYNQNRHACSSWYSDIVDRATQMYDVDAGVVHSSEMKVQMMIHSYPILTYIAEICLDERDIHYLLDEHKRAGAQRWYDDFRKEYPKIYSSLREFSQDLTKWTDVVKHSNKVTYGITRKTFEERLATSCKLPRFSLA
jgi:hypothetical protein